jgi:hypothetical protein
MAHVTPAHQRPLQDFRSRQSRYKHLQDLGGDVGGFSPKEVKEFGQFPTSNTFGQDLSQVGSNLQDSAAALMALFGGGGAGRGVDAETAKRAANSRGFPSTILKHNLVGDSASIGGTAANPLDEIDLLGPGGVESREYANVMANRPSMVTPGGGTAAPTISPPPGKVTRPTVPKQTDTSKSPTVRPETEVDEPVVSGDSATDDTLGDRLRAAIVNQLTDPVSTRALESGSYIQPGTEPTAEHPYGIPNLQSVAPLEAGINTVDEWLDVILGGISEGWTGFAKGVGGVLDRPGQDKEDRMLNMDIQTDNLKKMLRRNRPGTAIYDAIFGRQDPYSGPPLFDPSDPQAAPPAAPPAQTSLPSQPNEAFITQLAVETGMSPQSIGDLMESTDPVLDFLANNPKAAEHIEQFQLAPGTVEAAKAIIDFRNSQQGDAGIVPIPQQDILSN